MTIRVGTNDISGLLSVVNQTVAEFGPDRIAEIFAAELAAHNRISQDLISDLVDFTTTPMRVAGITSDGEMMEVDEYGAAPTQKPFVPGSLGTPLKAFQHNVGWTEKWMLVKTPSDLALTVQNAEVAHLRALKREIQRAFFRSANYTFIDALVNKVSLPIKRLANADSFAIPTGPNGETFDPATHTHYVGTATLTVAGIQAVIDNVVEHGVEGPVKLAISTTNETAFRALGAPFVAATDVKLVQSTTTLRTVDSLDMDRMNDRLIGRWGAAEVWVKPWAIANYAVAYDAGANVKPLSFRQRTSTTLQGLRVAAENSLYPLTAKFMEAEFGVAVWNRTKMAVNYFANGTYADPTI